MHEEKQQAERNWVAPIITGKSSAEEAQNFTNNNALDHQFPGNVGS